MAKQSDWLLRELPDLLNRGVLDEAAAARLRAHYAQARHEPELGMVVLAIGGAILIGLGVILLFAHNWQNWTPELRVGLSLLPLLIGQLACAYAIRNGSRLWAEAAGVFTTLAIGASIALIAQTYQFGGDLPRFMLTWSLLALPLVYLLDASAVAALFWAGILGWALSREHQNWGAIRVETILPTLQFFLLTSLPLPHLIRHARLDRGNARVVWMLRVLLIVLVAGYATTASLHFNLFLGYGAMAAVAMLLGRGYFSGLSGAWGNPLWSVGSMGVFLLTLLMTYHDAWRDRFPATPETLLVPALFTVVAFILAGQRARKGDLLLPPLIAGLPLLIGMMMGSGEAQISWPLIISHVYLLSLAAALIHCGLDEQRLGLANMGISLIAGLILIRFFDSELSYVLRGTAFIAVGVSFFVANIWLRRHVQRREAS